MKENPIEYEAVRNEAIRVQDSIANETIYMYVAYITLFSIGFSHTWIFLASFIVLIVFQAMINENTWEMKKCSTFIRVFFEECSGDMHWEGLHSSDEYKDGLRAKRESKIGWKLYKYSSTFLALISLISLILVTCGKNSLILSTSDIILIVLGAMLFCLATYVNVSMFVNSKDDDKELDTFMRDWQKSKANDDKK